MEKEYTMKLKRLLFIPFITFFLGAGLHANPVVAPTIINEFGFTATGWKMELHIQTYSGNDETWVIPLDSMRITSMTDTAYIKPGLTVTDSTYVILTNADLTEDLSIDPAGDQIMLWDMGSFSFGSKTENYPDLPIAPEIGESIGVFRTTSTSYKYYIDTSPTFGAPNDTSGAMGYLSGIVVDSTGVGIAGAEVRDWYFGIEADSLTDANGHFRVRLISGTTHIVIQKADYDNAYPSIFVWPDSTVTDTFTLTRIVHATEPEYPVAEGYSLEQNYPNPFNATTSFAVRLPQETHLEVAIYDVHGRLVEQLYQGRHASGQFTMTWNAENVASGIYYYRIKTPESTLQKKCILLK